MMDLDGVYIAYFKSSKTTEVVSILLADYEICKFYFI